MARSQPPSRFTFSPEYPMNRIRWIVAGAVFATVIGVAALDSTAQAQTGKTATLKGKVTYDGTPPAPASLVPKFASVPNDAAHCAKGDTEDPTWVVNAANKGVANAVVFLKFTAAPKYDFKATGHPAEVVVDQPFCAF